MSQQRPRRRSLPPERFRPPAVDPPQHAVRERPAGAPASPRLCASTPSQPRMDAPRAAAPRPPPQDLQPLSPPAPAQFVQHVHQQLFFSAVPTAVARPVLPAEDLWSLDGLRAHASASVRPAAAPAKWHHGKRGSARERTVLLPAASPLFSPPPASPSSDGRRRAEGPSFGESSVTAVVPTVWGSSPPQSVPLSAVASSRSDTIAGATTTVYPAVSGLVADVLAYAVSQNRAAVVAVGATNVPLPVAPACAPSQPSSLVSDVLAYAASQRAATTGADCASVSAPAPAAPRLSSLVSDVLAHARAEADKAAAAEFAAARAVYADGVARVRLLERAGRSLDALELSRTLVPPPVCPPSISRTLSPSTGRPVGAALPAPRALSVRPAGPQLTCTLDDWRSLVAAASDPSSVATTSPVHVILEGIRDLNPGARRARAVAVVAAARLVPFMTIEMIATFLGCPQSEFHVDIGTRPAGFNCVDRRVGGHAGC